VCAKLPKPTSLLKEVVDQGVDAAVKSPKPKIRAVAAVADITNMEVAVVAVAQKDRTMIITMITNILKIVPLVATLPNCLGKAMAIVSVRNV
jgi:hypothetical protein